MTDFLGKKKPRILAIIMALVGIAGNIYVFSVASEVIAKPGDEGSAFRQMYYLMITPMFLTTMLIYAITKHEQKYRKSSNQDSLIYFLSTMLALGLTLHSGWRIKDAKEEAGYNFPAAAKQKMERYKTDLFKGRLKGFKDPHPDEAHLPYEEQILRSEREKLERQRRILESKDDKKD